MTFYEKMRIVCLAIPEGRVATYGQIAMLCGSPRNSRQVGFGLKRELAGEDIPAHRIVNSCGVLSGAGQFGIPGWQQSMLAAEGVEVLRDGERWRVDLKKYGWRTTVEEAERFLRLFSGEEAGGNREGWDHGIVS